ncbi:hypothetical protein SBDP1_510013 [Syntrophobacter sp. SbD1]|nr:hypothetical protein SBDP1_510013 [Syntrophobacter sp. SbD1]
MKRDKKPIVKDELRTRAESCIATGEIFEDVASDFAKDMVHELRVHQVELEMQNEELRRAQAEIEESRARYSDLYDFAPVGYLTLDEHGLVMEANLTLAKQLGIERTHLINKPFHLFSQSDGETIREHLRTVFETQTPQTCRVLLLGKNGEKIYARMESIFIAENNGAKRCRTNVIDITLARQAEAAIRQSRDELAQVPARLLAAQEEDRKRLAGELHDSIGQTLAALKFRIEHILDVMKNGKFTEGMALLEQFIPTLQYSIDETRTIYMGLRPQLLDDFGVIAAIHWYRCELMKLYPHIHIEAEMRIEELDIPERLKIAIFRISQEALNNVTKHARAEWVDLVLVKHCDMIELSVSDDGIGFDLDQVHGCPKSYGLSGMKERTEQSGGKLTIESVPGKGTTVRVVWCIPEGNNDWQEGLG